MTDGTTKLNRKSVLDDSSSIMSGVNVFNPFETRRASIVRHGGGRIITEVYELWNGDRRRPTGTEGGVLDDGTKSRMNKQCLKTYSEFFLRRSSKMAYTLRCWGRPRSVNMHASNCQDSSRVSDRDLSMTLQETFWTKGATAAWFLN